MLEFDPLYRRYGFNKLTHFLSPVVIKTDTFIFPFNSELHYFKLTEEPLPITKKEPILQSHPKIFCKNVLGYGSDEIIGRYIKESVQPLKFLKSLSVDSEIRYLLPNMGVVTIPRKSLVVYNYTTCQYGYRFQKNLRRKLWKYENLTNALINTTEKTLRSKNVFITFELPSKLPSRERLDLFSKDLSPQRIRSLEDYRYFNVLALWKFLTPSLKENSWLAKWKKEDRIRINLLMMKDTNMVMVNLGLLESIVKEYNEETPTTVLESLYSLFQPNTEEIKMLTKGEYKSKDVRKQILIFLNTLINREPPTIDLARGFNNPEIDKLNQEILESDNKNIDLDNIDFDKLIEEFSGDDNENLDSIDGEEIEFKNDEEDPENLVQEDDEEIDESDYYVQVKNTTKEFSNLTELYQDKDDSGLDILTAQIDYLKEDGQINKSKENMLKNLVNDQTKKTFNINGEAIPLEKILDVSLDLGSIEVKNSPVRDIPVVFDKSYNQNKIKSLDKQYLTEFMERDNVRVAYSLQKSGYIIEDYSVDETSTILDTTQLHTIKVRSVEGKTSTLRYYLPKIDEDGSFKMSGNTYRMRKQRSETPIRKISPRKVALSSYYGKLFIDKAYRKNQQYSNWFLKNLYKNPEVENIVEGELSYPDVDVNNMYGTLSKSIKSFVYMGYLFRFDYMSRSFGLPDNVLRDIENNGIVIGKSNSNDDDFLLMNNEDYKIYKYNIKKNTLEYWMEIYDLIGASGPNDGPIEFAGVKINGDYVPVVILLSYYMGLENLIKTLNVKYFVDKKDEESAKMKKLWDKEELRSMTKIKFLDSDLYFSRDHGISDMILGGLTSNKIFRDTLFTTWNNKSSFPAIYANLGMSPATQVEINVMENMFIDPMTLSLLKAMGEPETFKGLLIKASELLVTENYKHPNDISGQVVKGYERLNGMLYRSMTRALVKTEIESIFSTSKLTMDPYEIMKIIKDDSTTVNIDDLNPLATIKQAEDLSYLGLFGRDVITMVKKTRSIHPSEIGTISEAVKDNGQVGVTAYLTADPNITNMRGTVEEIDASTSGWGKLFSTAGLLTQWGDKDDMKRLKCKVLYGVIHRCISR